MMPPHDIRNATDQVNALFEHIGFLEPKLWHLKDAMLKVLAEEESELANDLRRHHRLNQEGAPL